MTTTAMNITNEERTLANELADAQRAFANQSKELDEIKKEKARYAKYWHDDRIAKEKLEREVRKMLDRIDALLDALVRSGTKEVQS